MAGSTVRRYARQVWLQSGIAGANYRDRIFSWRLDLLFVARRCISPTKEKAMPSPSSVSNSVAQVPVPVDAINVARFLGGSSHEWSGEE
jgi:hypothetical protein